MVSLKLGMTNTLSGFFSAPNNLHMSFFSDTYLWSGMSNTGKKYDDNLKVPNKKFECSAEGELQGYRFYWNTGRNRLLPVPLRQCVEFMLSACWRMVNATVERRRAKSDLSARRRHVRYLYRTWMKSFLTDELGVKTMKFISSRNSNTQIIGPHTNRSLFFLGLVKDKV